MSSENLGAIPIYQKAESLYEISSHLASFISFNNDRAKIYQTTSLRDSIANAILTDASLISRTMAQTLSSKSYSERIKNTAFIHIMIRNLNSYCIGLEMDGVKEKEYLNLLRYEMKSFRTLFKTWINSLPNSSEGLS